MSIMKTDVQLLVYFAYAIPLCLMGWFQGKFNTQ